MAKVHPINMGAYRRFSPYIWALEWAHLGLWEPLFQGPWAHGLGGQIPKDCPSNPAIFRPIWGPPRGPIWAPPGAHMGQAHMGNPQGLPIKSSHIWAQIGPPEGLF